MTQLEMGMPSFEGKIPKMFKVYPENTLDTMMGDVVGATLGGSIVKVGGGMSKFPGVSDIARLA